MRIIIEMPESTRDQLVEALCANYGYQPSVVDETGEHSPNPVTPGQFAQAVLVQWAKDHIAAYRVRVTTETARQSQQAELAGLEAGVTITEE